MAMYAGERPSTSRWLTEEWAALAASEQALEAAWAASQHAEIASARFTEADCYRLHAAYRAAQAAARELGRRLEAARDLRESR